MRTTTTAWALLSLAAMAPGGILLSCSSDAGRDVSGTVSSRSYQGHENDLDANNLVGAYPTLAGTRLDDCQTCHTGRMEGGRLVGSACDQCHDLLLHGTGHVALLPGELWLLLAYERDGSVLDPSALDVADGTLKGEGPLRLIVPQANPGRPDRGSRYSPTSCGDGLDFREDADHNAGSMVRGAIAVRIDPMPEGVEEFDFMNGGWAYVNAGQLILYGHGVR